MTDPVDRLPCQDVVCARGGHFVCHDMPPPDGPPASLPVGWRDEWEHGPRRLRDAVREYTSRMAELDARRHMPPPRGDDDE